jgi:hypothetical protein
MASSWSSAAESEHDPEFADLPEKAPPIDLPTERLAIVSIVAGIAGFFLPIVGPVTAIVSGHVARDEIRKAKGRLGGDGLARTGLVLGYVWVGLTVIALLVMMSLTFVMIQREPSTLRVHGAAAVTNQEPWIERWERERSSPVMLSEVETLPAAPSPPKATVRFLSPTAVTGSSETPQVIELRRFRPSMPALPIPPAEPDAS